MMDIQELESSVGDYCEGCLHAPMLSVCGNCELARFIAWLKEKEGEE